LFFSRVLLLLLLLHFVLLLFKILKHAKLHLKVSIVVVVWVCIKRIDHETNTFVLFTTVSCMVHGKDSFLGHLHPAACQQELLLMAESELIDGGLGPLRHLAGVTAAKGEMDQKVAKVCGV